MLLVAPEKKRSSKQKMGIFWDCGDKPEKKKRQLSEEEIKSKKGM